MSPFEEGVDMSAEFIQSSLINHGGLVLMVIVWINKTSGLMRCTFVIHGDSLLYSKLYLLFICRDIYFLAFTDHFLAFYHPF